MQPLPNIVERFHLRNIINDNDAMCAAIVAACDCPKAFLSGRIPNLQLDSLAVQLDSANFLRARRQRVMKRQRAWFV